MAIFAISGFPNYGISQDGSVYNLQTHRFLEPTPDSGGYLHLRLYKNKKPHEKLIHRLVLETFVGPCPDGMECCHNNGDRHDNRLENLRWSTHKNNMKDSTKHGTRAIGEKHGRAKLNELQVRVIRWLLKFGKLTRIEIARIFGVNIVTIGHIKVKKNLESFRIIERTITLTTINIKLIVIERISDGLMIPIGVRQVG